MMWKYDHIGYYTNDNGPMIIGIGVGTLFFGLLVMRFAIALLGYILWLLFSPIMIIFLMIAMLIICISSIVGISYDTGGQVLLSFILAAVIILCMMLCAVAFRYMLGDTTEDIVVWLLRLSV